MAVTLAEAQAIEAPIAERAALLNDAIAIAHNQGIDVDIDALPAGWNGHRSIGGIGSGLCSPKVAVEVRANPCSLKA